MPQHRAGRLKQTNKAHKLPGGTRPSKEKAVQGRAGPSLSGLSAARASTGSHVTNSNANGAKQARLNRQKQLMAEKRVALFKQRRQQQSSVSRIVTVLPLSADVDLTAFHTSLRALTHEWTHTQTTHTPHRLSVSYNCASQRCGFVFLSDPTVLTDHTTAVGAQALCEMLSVSDTVLLVADYDEQCMTHPLVDKLGERLLTFLAHNGHPNVSFSLFSQDAAQTPKRLNLRNPPKFWRAELDRVQQVLTQILKLPAENKPLDLSDVSLARGLSDVSGNNMRWRSFRAYLHSTSVCVESETPVDVSAITEDCVERVRGVRGRVSVSGCLRGIPLSVHSILHITGVGPVKLKAVQGERRRATDGALCERVESDPSQQDDLTAEAVPDALCGEQTWPTQDELAHDMDDTAHAHNEDDEDLGDDDDDFFAGLEQIPSQKKSVYATTEALAGNTQDGEGLERDDDYVDVPEDQSARTRFSRYRALQSFRSSYWHPREGLPFTYGKIFQFDDFKGLQKSVLSQIELTQNAQVEPLLEKAREKKREKKRARSVCGGSVCGESMSVCEDAMDEDCDESVCEDAMSESGAQGVAPTQRALSGSDDSLCVHGMPDYVRSDQWVRLELDDVPLDLLYERLRVCGSLSLFSLHTHECKTSVVHFNIHTVPGFTQRVKSKTPLLFYNGFRYFLSKPIFSESNLNCDKHKFTRSLTHGAFTVASCVAPVCMTPHSPVLVFKPTMCGSQCVWELVATGNTLSVDPDRIMLKKIVIFGNPIRVRKRTAVIKHMFFDPQDVKYFRPAQLHTLHGLRAHITESVGTHGLYKALFSAPVKQNDQVLLSLYKRVFPKIPTEDELLQSGVVSVREMAVCKERVRDAPSVDFASSEKSSVIVK